MNTASAAMTTAATVRAVTRWSPMRPKHPQEGRNSTVTPRVDWASDGIPDRHPAAATRGLTR